MSGPLKKVQANEYYRAGKVKSAHGLRGEIYILIFSKEMAWLDQLKELRLVKFHAGQETIHILTPTQIKPHKDGFLVKPEELNNRNESESFKGALLEIPGSFLITSEEEEGFYLNEVLNFKVILKDVGEIGEIINFSGNGMQDLLVIKTKEGEFEVPFVDDFIIAINTEDETIEMDFPEGLLEKL